MNAPRLRHELHYCDRLVRCFAERPANLDAMLHETVARWPEATAIVDGARRVSYRELGALVDGIAGNLAAAGFEKGDRLALLIGNRIEFITTLLAAIRIGVITVPLNIRQKAPEIAFVLNQCTAAGLIYEAELIVNLPLRTTVPSLRQVFAIGEASTPDRSFAELMRPSTSPPAAALAEEDIVCLLYTSGTTGKPKGAKLTHLGLVHSVLHYEHAMQLRSHEVSILAVPASHVTGLVANILTMIRVGGTSVLMPAFKAGAFLELAEREAMTHALIVPAMYNLCLIEPDFAKFDLQHWRIGGFGGAPMPVATIARLGEALPNLTLLNIYGSTETTSPCTLLPPGHIKHQPDSVGTVLPCADVVIVDEEGREVPPGTAGELWIGGPMTVPGYWRNEEADARGFAAGYWRSGDIGSKDAQGYVRVFDRIKDMINRAGYKIYCIEVENVLAHHPGVLECAVVGIADPVLGERVKAFIVPCKPAPDAPTLRAYCSERLSDYKVPEVIEFLDAPLPRNANGKVLKTALRQA